MVKKKAISDAELDAAHERAEETRKLLQHKPGLEELLTPEELADAAPFYFELRAYIKQLKEAREAQRLTLVQMAERTGMAMESLSRLETGALTNPTWKTLGSYAAALGLRPKLTVEHAE